MAHSNDPENELQSGEIRVVRPEEFDSNTAQTPGSKRVAAVPGMSTSESQPWGGLFFVEPRSQTAIHHYGVQETIVYVLEGQALIRWGKGGEFEAVANSGDFIHVPPLLPHREANPSDSVTSSWVVVRSTWKPIVVNLPSDYWYEDDGFGDDVKFKLCFRMSESRDVTPTQVIERWSQLIVTIASTNAITPKSYGTRDAPAASNTVRS